MLLGLRFHTLCFLSPLALALSTAVSQPDHPWTHARGLASSVGGVFGGVLLGQTPDQFTASNGIVYAPYWADMRIYLPLPSQCLPFSPFNISSFSHQL